MKGTKGAACHANRLGRLALVAGLLLTLCACDGTTKRATEEATAQAPIALGPTATLPPTSPPSPTRSPTSAPPPTRRPSLISTPTPEPTPTPTRPPALPVSEGTPVTLPQEAISPANAARVGPLARWGREGARQVAWSPDGALVAVGTYGGIYLHDAASLAEVGFIDAEAIPVADLAFSPDGAWLAAGAGYLDRMVWVWDPHTGELARTFTHREYVSAFAWSPDGTVMATASHNGTAKQGATRGTVYLWRVSDGTLLQALVGHASRIEDLVFSPDGQTLASAGGLRDNNVQLWRVQDGALLHTLTGYAAEVRSLAFSPDSSTLASGSYDGTVRLWRAGEGALLGTLNVAGPRVSFSPDGVWLAVWGAGASLRPAEACARPEGACDAASHVLEGSSERIQDLAFGPLPPAGRADEILLATASDDGTARVWRAGDGRLLVTLDSGAGAVQGLAFRPDGTRLAAVTDDGTVRFWQVGGCAGETGECGVPEQSVTGSSGYVNSLAFHPDGKMVVAAVGDALQFRQVSDGTVLRRLESLPANSHTVALSPDGALLAAGVSNAVWLWEASDGSPLAPLEGHTGFVTVAAFSPDGTLLASASADYTVRLWRVADGGVVQVLEHEGAWYGDARVQALAFSPDGSPLASGTEDATIRLWQVEDGGLLDTLEGHTGIVWDVAFSRDGQRLASASSDGTVRLWQVEDGSPLHILPALRLADRPGEGHTAYVHAVDFCPDGRVLVSGAYDGTVLLWGTEDGRLLSTLEGHLESVEDVACNPDGTMLASASGDGSLRLWAVTVQEGGVLPTRTPRPTDTPLPAETILLVATQPP